MDLAPQLIPSPSLFKAHLFLMINHFREQMLRPLVGIGHSFGGNIMSVKNDFSHFI